MLQATLRDGTADRALGLRGVRAAPRRAAAATAWSPAPDACSTRSPTSASATTSSHWLRDGRRRRRRDARLARRLPLHRDRSGATPRARSTSRSRPCWSSRGRSRECVLLETLLLSILNHDSAIATAAVAHDHRRRRPPVHRDGLAPHPRGGGGRGGAGRVRRGLRRDVQPRGRPHATASRRPAPAPTRSRCCTTPSATRSRRRSRRSGPARRCWSTPTTSPRRSAPRSRSAGAELGGVRLDSGDLVSLARTGAPAARRARRHRHPHHRHERPRRVRDRRAGRGPGRRLRRRHLARDRLGRADQRLRLQAGRRAPATTATMVSVAKKSQDKVSVGGRKYALRRLDADRTRRRPRSSASAPPRARRRRPRRCWSSWCATASASTTTTLDGGPRPAAGVARASCPPPARQLSKGDPVLATIYEDD